MIESKTRKEEIIEAAAKLFKEKGYAASTMRDLAESVGIEAASLYNHIKSKDQILGDICTKIGEMFTRKMDLIDGAYSSNRDKVMALIETHIEITTTYAAMASVTNDEWRHLDEPQLTEFVKMRDAYEAKFLTFISQGIEDGDFQAENATTALYTILSSVRWLQYWYKPERGLTIDEIKAQITNLLMKGLSNHG